MNKPALSSSLVAALGIGGCAIHQPAPVTTSNDPAETHEAIRADLDKLRALDVVSVGGIIRDLPAEATGCYFDNIGGLPCPGWEDEVAAADARLRPRLDKLVEDASTAITHADPAYAMDSERVAADLEALRALQIVEIGQLITTTAPNNPACYNLPCPDDKAAADEANRVRAAKLSAITTAVKK